MDTTDERQAHDELLELLRSDSFSGVACVSHQGHELLKHAGGFSNRRTGELNHLETKFPAASVSKMLTAICLARLVDAGHCGFHQSLIEIVPSLEPHFDSRISLASLLSHRSGLGDYLDEEAEFPFTGIDVATLDCLQAFLPYVLKAPLNPPGEYFYSSAGFILLGLAIESITGKSFPEALARWVTEPAGLTSTGFPRLDVPSADLAVGYLQDGRPYHNHLPPVGGPDGGIVTTVMDMQRLFGHLRGENFIGKPSRQFLWKNISKIGASEYYGHGFIITESCGHSWYGHTGSDPGISARVAFSPQPASSIVVLCNCDRLAFRVFRRIFNWLKTTESFRSMAAARI